MSTPKNPSHSFLTLPVLIGMAAMAVVVLASNILVQKPFEPFGLQDFLTWGAFTYPIAFLITDLTNRWFGPSKARLVIAAGFVVAVALSLYFAGVRVAVASGSAFLVAQLLDVSLFNWLRRSGGWWKAPLVSSFLGSLIDTLIFFPAAFAGLGDDFINMVQTYNVLGSSVQAETWVAWAVCDFGVKMLVAICMLVPYGAIRRARPDYASA